MKPADLRRILSQCGHLLLVVGLADGQEEHRPFFRRDLTSLKRRTSRILRDYGTVSSLLIFAAFDTCVVCLSTFDAQSHAWTDAQ